MERTLKKELQKEDLYTRKMRITGYIFINWINLYKLEADSGKLELEFGNNGLLKLGS